MRFVICLRVSCSWQFLKAFIPFPGFKAEFLFQFLPSLPVPVGQKGLIPLGSLGLTLIIGILAFPILPTSNTAPSPADTTRVMLQVLPKPDQTEPDFFFHFLLYLEQIPLHEKERGTNQY